jgi:RNA polymerase sigma-70 factor (ECF subfamily)
MQPRDAFVSEALAHRAALHRVALRLTGNQGEAEDLVQEAFTRALAAWSTYRPGTNCRAWMARIVENCFITHRRRDARFRRWVEGADTRSPGAEATLPATPISGRTEAALRRLPAAFAGVVVLCDVQGKSYRRAAAELGVPIGTVMSRLHRARRALRRSLRDAAADWGFRAAA